MSESCPKGWWQDVSQLFNGGWLAKWKENKYLCRTELWNQVATAYAIAAVLAAFSAAITRQVLISVLLPFILTTLFLMPNFWSIPVTSDIKDSTGKEAEQFDYSVRFAVPQYQDTKDTMIQKRDTITDLSGNFIGLLEHFVDAPPGASKGTETALVEPALTLPNARNPLMNVDPTEQKYNPFRQPAADVSDPAVKNYLDKFFRVQWFSDPTDVFGKNQGQRQFYTMPSTSIPNDEKSFRDWLYKLPFKTCKEGGREACVPGSGGGYIPWLQVNEY